MRGLIRRFPSIKSIKNIYSADKKYLTKILHNDDDVCYNFEYDKYGRQTKVTVGNGAQSKNLITNGYAYSSGKLIETSTYGNGYVLAQTSLSR